MQKVLSKTYREVANEFGVDEFKGGERDAINAFAQYLDSFQTLDSKLEILALYKAREIDKEVLLGLANALGKEKTEEVIKGIYAKHKHQKNGTEKPVPAGSKEPVS